MPEKMKAYTYLTLAMIIVGSSVVFGKVITQSFPIFLASGLRFAIASMLLLPLLVKSREKRARPTRKDWGHLLFMAFCGQVVFTFFVLLGLRYTSAIEAGLITSASPAMMAAVSWLFFREKPLPIQLFAIITVVFGIVIVNDVFSIQSASDNPGRIWGNLLMVGAVIGEAFFLLMRKRISTQISNLDLTAYLCAIGFAFFLPLAVWQAMDFNFSSVSAGAWLSMLYFGAVFTVFAYLFWFKGVSMVSGSVAGIFTAVMPISAVILSILFLNETFGRHHGIGGGLILISIALSTIGQESGGKNPP